ncbi:hypothetical protein SL1157_1523 [Ruegeria lacuscaerulensis ITI-1157]|nr:hypothetical protein SL1157_1523 [Ruegeria lacuscaerulensis ITI-1157]
MQSGCTKGPVGRGCAGEFCLNVCLPRRRAACRPSSECGDNPPRASTPRFFALWRLAGMRPAARRQIAELWPALLRS